MLCVLLFRVYIVCPLSVLLPVLANKDVHIFLISPLCVSVSTWWYIC